MMDYDYLLDTNMTQMADLTNLTLLLLNGSIDIHSFQQQAMNDSIDQESLFNYTKIIFGETNKQSQGLLSLEDEFKDIDWDKLYDLMQHEQDALMSNNRLGDTAHYSLIVAYSVVITLGLIGNIAIIMAFLANKVMLTTRNIFIVNLAVSDIFLCAFTMPLTLVDLITKYWTLGPQQAFLCKIIGTIQSSCIFFSSFSIVLIAIDRHRFIVKSSQPQISPKQAMILSVIALGLAIGLSSPLFYFTKLEIKENLFTDKTFSYCFEAWGSPTIRLLYTVICFLSQFIIPCGLVIWGYVSIFTTLRNSCAMDTLSTHRRARQLERRRRTNCMLVLVSLLFFSSWAPLNIFNIVLDSIGYFEEQQEKEQESQEDEKMLVWYAVVHLIAMSSACANPIAYGFLNENFKQSLHDTVSKIPLIKRFYKRKFPLPPNRHRSGHSGNQLRSRSSGGQDSNKNSLAFISSPGDHNRHSCNISNIPTIRAETVEVPIIMTSQV